MLSPAREAIHERVKAERQLCCQGPVVIEQAPRWRLNEPKDQDASDFSLQQSPSVKADP